MCHSHLRLEAATFSTLCWVRADTSNVRKDRNVGPIGFYYRQDFKVVLKCGLTELEAQISWLEDVRILIYAPKYA